jgi:hypothetical protein
MTTTGKAILGFVAVAAMSAGFTTQAFAQTERTEGPPPTDPLMAWSEDMMPHNKFALNSDRNIELIRYSTPRDVEICIGKPDPDSVFGTRKAVPVKVMWDKQEAEIQPGNCMSFDAKQVKVQPASALPDDSELIGTFKVIH